ncbi:hypothetical protein AK812_SmicGene33003 [Symbiodinium microadriaticum]|uniref:Uncharacterized protein n=1 Tax=Symbiodinium microadriaticum TaxID=2951 RepID=A0A1Q9CSR7_SYMMI|nr:hypothetical protein AK812_SmicGene33003 [Symbiodinium microadriaticum]
MTIFLQAGPDQMELVESVRQIPSIDPTLCHQDKMNAVRRTTPQQYLDRKALAKDITEIESHLSGETIRNFKSVRPFNPSGHYNTEWVQFHLDVELRPPLGSGESSETAGIEESRLDFGKGVGHFLVLKAALREQLLAKGEDTLRRIYGFNRVPGARAVIDEFLDSENVIERPPE